MLNMKNTVTLLIVFMWQATGLLFAQTANTSWSFRQCVEYAMQHNIQAQQLQLQAENATISLQQSQHNRLPNLNANFSHGLNYGRSIDPFTNTFNTQAIQASQLSLGSSVVLYNGMRQKNTIELRKLELEAANWDIKELRNNLELNVLSAYLQVLLAEEQQRILEQQAEVTQRQYNQTESFVKAGALPSGNLLDIEAQIANDRLNIVNAKNAVASAYLGLSQILNYYNLFAVVKPAIGSFSPNAINLLTAEQVYETAIATQPQIQGALLRTRAAEQSLKVAEGAKYPTVALSANFSTLYSSRAQEIIFGNTIDTSFTNFFTLTGTPIVSLTPEYTFKKTAYPKQLWNNLGGFLGVNVNIPIFNQFQVKNAIKQSRLNVSNTYLAQENAKVLLRQQIEQAYLNARSAAQRIEATEVNVAALRQSVNQTEKRMNAGASTSLDYLNVKNNLTIAELNLESARYEYYFRLKILDFYQGKPILLE